MRKKINNAKYLKRTLIRNYALIYRIVQYNNNKDHYRRNALYIYDLHFAESKMCKKIKMKTMKGKKIMMERERIALTLIMSINACIYCVFVRAAFVVATLPRFLLWWLLQLLGYCGSTVVLLFIIIKFNLYIYEYIIYEDETKLGVRRRATTHTLYSSALHIHNVYHYYYYYDVIRPTLKSILFLYFLSFPGTISMLTIPCISYAYLLSQLLLRYIQTTNCDTLTISQMNEYMRAYCNIKFNRDNNNNNNNNNSNNNKNNNDDRKAERCVMCLCVCMFSLGESLHRNSSSLHRITTPHNIPFALMHVSALLFFSFIN